MTSSSSPGIALKQEGITYIAGAELPCVLVNMMRCGPGLGGIQPSQADYFQATRGGGNGDYRLLVYAPANIQEVVDLVMEAFDVADYYRNPVLVLGDGMIGQMMEPVALRERVERELPPKKWATTGTSGVRPPNIVNSLYIEPHELEVLNLRLKKKYDEMKVRETRWETFRTDDAEIVFVAFGTTSRIVRNAIEILRSEGIKAGLIRPITVWPFPDQAFDELPGSVRALMAVEMSLGQMVDDVRIVSRGRWPVGFYGRAGGMIPSEHEIADAARAFFRGAK
jgi:2-oxoglutarate ferredoxin oxidoreductase subunit alpha